MKTMFIVLVSLLTINCLAQGQKILFDKYLLPICNLSDPIFEECDEEKELDAFHYFLDLNITYAKQQCFDEVEGFCWYEQALELLESIKINEKESSICCGHVMTYCKSDEQENKVLIPINYCGYSASIAINQLECDDILEKIK